MEARLAASPDRAPGPASTCVLSVIIVTWNVREDVLRCLASLEREARGMALEVFVVDNASSDGTVEAVRERFPDAVVIENRENVGFPRANNQALRRARGRYVLFLNPDTEVGPGVLQACVEELEREPDVGMVGCRLVYPDGRTQYECARNAYRLRHLLIESLWLHMLFPRHPVFAHQLIGDWDHLGERDVEALMGAFMMARREVALGVGGLPDELFMYHEDLAFCLRVRTAGWRIRYLGGVTTVHHSGQSSKRSPARLYLLEGEYKLRLIREGQGTAHALAARAVFAARSLLRLAIALPGALPGLGRVRRRWPNVFHVERHLLQLAWSLWPGLVRSRIPMPKAEP